MKLGYIAALLGLSLMPLFWPPVDGQGSEPSSALTEAQDKFGALQVEIRAFKELLATVAAEAGELQERVEALATRAARDSGWATRKADQIGAETQALLLKFRGLWDSRAAIDTNAAQFGGAIQRLLDSGEITSKRGRRSFRKLADMERLWEREDTFLEQMESSLIAAGSSLDEASDSLADNDIPQALKDLEETSNRLNDFLRGRRQSLPILRELESLFASLGRDLLMMERLARARSRQARANRDLANEPEPRPLPYGTLLAAVLDSAYKSARVQLFDLQGRLIMDKEVTPALVAASPAGLFDTRGLLANGVYLYVVIIQGLDGRTHWTRIEKLVLLR